MSLFNDTIFLILNYEKLQLIKTLKLRGNFVTNSQSSDH